MRTQLCYVRYGTVHSIAHSFSTGMVHLLERKQTKIKKLEIQGTVLFEVWLRYSSTCTVGTVPSDFVIIFFSFEIKKK